MSDAKSLINHTSMVDKANFVQTGWGDKSVRLKSGKRDVGFATTTYSHHMTEEIKAYSAERILLLMTFAKGLTNDDIRPLIERIRR